MRETIGIYSDVALDTGDFLACVIAFFSCGISVFDTLGINDDPAGLCGPTIADTSLAN